MVTNQRERLQWMVKAAEEWGRAHLHTPITIGSVQAPECCADGSLQMMIELESAGQQPQRVQCLVTLEPDGTLSCYVPDTERSSAREEV